MTANNDPSSAGAGRAKFSRRRLVLLVVIAVAAGVVIAMGWQRQLSFETLARHYEALRTFIAAHEVSAIAAYVALYIVAVALSIPVGVYLTVTGGILFGAILGGAAAVVGATIGAICIFLIAKSAIGEYFVRRAGWRKRWRKAFAPTPSTTCCFCDWCRSSRSGSSTSFRRCAGSRSRPSWRRRRWA